MKADRWCRYVAWANSADLILPFCVPYERRPSQSAILTRSEVKVCKTFIREFDSHPRLQILSGTCDWSEAVLQCKLQIARALGCINHAKVATAEHVRHVPLNQ